MTDQPAKNAFKIAAEAVEAMEAENVRLKQRLQLAERRAEDAEEMAARAEDGAFQMVGDQYANQIKALEGERDTALDRVQTAEAKIQAVLNALGVGITAEGKPHYSTSAADDELVQAWPALDGEFLAQEELEHRREIISALDTVAPEGITITEIINDAWGWGRAMSEDRAQRILERLALIYPGLIVEAKAGYYRATVPIAPRNEAGEIGNDIAVATTDWDALLDAAFAKLKADEIEPMPEPGTEAKPRRRRKPTATPAPENPKAGVAAMMEAAERVMKAASAPKPAPKPVAVPAEGNANDAAIIRALEGAAQDRPGEFIKVADLHARAEAAGYTLTEAALRFRMKLAAKPLAQQRADIIEEQASPLAWRLRSPSPDGGDKIEADDAPAPAEPAPSSPMKDWFKLLRERAHIHLGWLNLAYGSDFKPMFRLSDGSMIEIKQLPLKDRDGIEVKREGVWRLIVDRKIGTGTHTIEIETFEIDGDGKAMNEDLQAYYAHSFSFEAVHNGKSRKYGKILNMIGTNDFTTVEQMLEQLRADNIYFDAERFRMFVAQVVITPITDKIERNGHVATAWKWKDGAKLEAGK